MKKTAAVLLIVMLAGCSSMGTGGYSSGGSNLNSGEGMGSGPAADTHSFINPRTGDLNLYHGG